MSVSIKERYRAARSLIRANGRYGMRWVAPDLREAMNHMLDQAQLIDFLATRQRLFRRQFPGVEARTPAARREAFMLTCSVEILLKYEMKPSATDYHMAMFNEQAW